MKSMLVISAIVLAVLQTAARAENYWVFRVKAALPAVMDGTDGTTVTRVTLTNNDIINLALGQPMTAAVSPHTEVLGLSTTFENGTPFGGGTISNPVSTLIVFNPSQSGTAQVTATVATLSNLSWNEAEFRTADTGQGIGSGNFLATTLGSPAQNGFVSLPFNGSAICSGPHIHDAKVSPRASATLFSAIQFNYTITGKPTVNFNGFITDGKLSISGNAIGTYTVP